MILAIAFVMRDGMESSERSMFKQSARVCCDFASDAQPLFATHLRFV
jgi:hypothetical protein